MMRRLSTRAWVVLMIALGLVATASGAGLVLSLHAGSRAQPAAAAASPGPQPGSAQARADLARMQSLLNSGSASKQAALLVPPFKFAPGSSSIVPAGKTITIRPGTFHASGQFATVQASVSDGTTGKQASGRTPAPGITSQNSSCRNQAGNELPELAGGSRLRPSCTRLSSSSEYPIRELNE